MNQATTYTINWTGTSANANATTWLTNGTTGYFVQPVAAQPVKETAEMWLRRRVTEITELAA